MKCTSMDIREYKIEIYLPEEYIEVMRDGLNEIGACKVGKYDNVISYSNVHGYWRPLDNTEPYSGRVGKINFGSECKMEIRCNKDLVKQVEEKIYNVHPYEEPLVNIIPLMNSHFE